MLTLFQSYTIIEIITAFIGIFIFYAPIILIIFILRKRRNKIIASSEKSNEIHNSSPIHKSPNIFNPYALKPYLLTKHEFSLYIVLQPIALKYNLILAIKPRMADFINVTLDRYVKGSRFNTYFNRIAYKHIDFLLLDNTSKPLMGFELDDKTHNRFDRIARDSFVDGVYGVIGLKVFHIYDFTNESIEEHIKQSLENVNQLS